MKFTVTLMAAACGAALAAGAAGAAPMKVETTSTVTAAAAGDAVSFEVFLPLRNTDALDALLKAQQTPGSASYHKWLTPAQFAAQFGPTPQAIANASKAITAQGLSVSAVHTRSITVAGTAAAVQQAFNTGLNKVTTSQGSTRYVAQSNLTLPAGLQGQGVVIAAFAGKPLLHTNAAVVTKKVDPTSRRGAADGYWHTDLRQAYDYPDYRSVDGTGVAVAILMENSALNSDVKLVFDHEKFTTVTGKPAPTFKEVKINGGAPFDANASAESSLDIQQVLGGAPGSSVTLVNIPNLSDANILSGYLYIVENNNAAIVNSSFGGCELGYSAAYNGGQDYYGILDTYDTLFKQGNAQGITFVASSGDEGGLECPDVNYFYGTGASRFTPSVSFPANSPHVTAVGGGNLITSDLRPALTSTYVSENALGDPEVSRDPYGFGANVAGGFWAAGGGVSDHFAQPDYQALVNTGSTTKRTLPDIGMHVGGCPGGISLTPCGPNRTFSIIALNGGFVGLIGTSVSSPEFVGALALYEQRSGRQGNLNPYLYRAAAAQATGGPKAFRRETNGFDGKWTDKYPGGGYDYLYGNGSPDVRVLFGMTDLPATGDPQTPSNP